MSLIKVKSCFTKKDQKLHTYMYITLFNKMYVSFKIDNKLLIRPAAKMYLLLWKYFQYYLIVCQKLSSLLRARKLLQFLY